MNSNQLGIITIGRSFICKQPSLVAKVFALIEFVPVRAEMLFVSDVIEYMGISSKFREVPPNVRPPEYDMAITEDTEGGNLTVEITEKK